MDISWADAAKALPAVVTAAATIIGLSRGPGALRSRLRHDAEILSKLPEGSPAHSALLAHVEREVDRIAKLETQASVDPSGLSIGIAGSLLLGLLVIYLVQLDHWLALIGATVVGFVALIFLYGIFESAQRVPRDKKGNRV